MDKMEQEGGSVEAVLELEGVAEASQETDRNGDSGAEVTTVSADTISHDLATEEATVENQQLDGSTATIAPPFPQPDQPVPDPQVQPMPGPQADQDVGDGMYGASPVASVQSGVSGVSGEMDDRAGSPVLEEPLTPATDNSSTTKSQPGSGRVTPASQSDQSLYMSSSEKGTPVRKRRLTDSGVRQIDFDNQSSSSGSIRNVRFPFRAGISWRKGERLEAMDFMHKWFPAKIREINEEEMTVLIHFDGWNQRFDEWVDMASDRIRPLIRHSERKDRAKRLKVQSSYAPLKYKGVLDERWHPTLQEYKIGEEVYAKWTDCKMYPAKVTGELPNGSYEVIFYDGFKKQVQPINIRPMPGDVKAKAFEVSPVTAGVPKKPKIKKEMGTGTSPTDDPNIISSPPGPKVKKEPRNRSRSRSTGKQRSRKNKVIPMEQFVPKEILFKDDGTGPLTEESLTCVVKSEPVSTQTDYNEPKMVIKEEPGTSDILPIPTVAISESIQTEAAYVKPVGYERGIPGLPTLPPKAFVVEPDHNHYKCHFENCNKGFRKEHLLEYHIKYYHIGGAEAPPPQPPKRRRKTTSSTESDCTPLSKKSGSKKPRHSSAECLPIREIKQEVKEEMDEVTVPLMMDRVKQETGEISTQTMLVRQEAVDDTQFVVGAGPDLESSLPGRTMSQDSMLTAEESSVTDVEDYLKPDELVNCICDYYEENGLMIQCEVCLCWQHASCFGITERTLPKTYVCFVCENPPGVRESSRYIHEQDWLKLGEAAAFSYLPNLHGGEERCQAMKTTHNLLADTHRLNTALHSLKLQLQVLRTKDEQKLKLWRMDWDVTETFQDDDIATNITDLEEKGVAMETAATETNATETSESEPGKVVFTLSTEDNNGVPACDKQENVANDAEINVTNNENDTGKTEVNDEVKPENNGAADSGSAQEVQARDGVEASKDDAEGKKDVTVTITATDSANEIANEMMSPVRDEKDAEEGTHSDSTESVVEDPIEMYERNLLNHIQRVQAEISERMDKMEEQITVLETLEGVGHRRVAPGEDVTVDMPHLKRTMRTLHDDLHKVKKMAVFH